MTFANLITWRFKSDDDSNEIDNEPDIDAKNKNV